MNTHIIAEMRKKDRGHSQKNAHRFGGVNEW
jgi:hypothetical protein